MSIATELLRAPHIGIRNLKNRLSWVLKRKSTFIVTDRGTPVEVLLPYSDMVEMIELINEATDSETLRAVQEGREAVKTGAEGIPVSKVFNKIKKERK
jgi:antitoxin (DNA-binding transcriptional repressor) of toxin-antitoxin stability system